MTSKTLDAFVTGTIDTMKRALEPRDVHLRSLESRVTELVERNTSLEQEVSDLVLLVHLLHDTVKVDPPKAAAVIRDVH